MNPEIAKEWFLKAQNDQFAIEDILKGDHKPGSVICFLSQQLAEKVLKGFLTLHEKRTPKTHQLDLLLELCKKIDKEFSSLEKAVIDLSEYYIETRYPGDIVEHDLRKAKTAFKEALEIKDFVFKKAKI